MWYIHFENPIQDIRFESLEDANKYYVMCRLLGNNVSLKHVAL